jgi:VanZ family protein
MSAGRFRGSAVVWGLLLAYASLYPFWPLRPPARDALASALMVSGHVMRSDVAFNIVAYVPFGLLLCLYFRSRGSRHAIAIAIGMSAAFSFAMETLQLFLPGRVTSIVDLATNTTGGALGAFAFADPVFSMATRPLGEMRERLVIPGGYGDAALVLLMLWLLAQLNPALPFFGAGDIGHGIEADLAALQWAFVAMGICGFGLFVSTLLASEGGSLRLTLMLLSVALWLKFAMASVMLQPHADAEWAGGGRIVGVLVGLAAFIPLRGLRRATRMYLAFVLILAASLFAKVFGAYSGMEDFLRVFRWPHGQLASFATLTRFIHELWPVATVVFLVALFLRTRRGPVT